jgi:peptide/nickel transport system ATP-binding protein
MGECLEKPPEIEIEDEHAAKCYLATHEYDPADALPEGYFDE